MAEDVVSVVTGEVIAQAGETITKEMADAIQNAAVSSVWVKGEERNIKVLSNMMVDLDAVVDIDPEEVGVYGRHGMVGKRTPEEIGIHAIRGGNIVGEHEVIFAGNDEIVKLSHSARSKAIFAQGAVNAANFLNGKEPRIYSMKDLVNG